MKLKVGNSIIPQLQRMKPHSYLKEKKNKQTAQIPLHWAEERSGRQSQTCSYSSNIGDHGPW